jgi:hypothetical protein
MLVFSTQIFTFFVSSFQSVKLGILDLNLRKKERKKERKKKNINISQLLDFLQTVQPSETP